MFIAFFQTCPSVILDMCGRAYSNPSLSFIRRCSPSKRNSCRVRRSTTSASSRRLVAASLVRPTHVSNQTRGFFSNVFEIQIFSTSAFWSRSGSPAASSGNTFQANDDHFHVVFYDGDVLCTRAPHLPSRSPRSTRGG